MKRKLFARAAAMALVLCLSGTAQAQAQDRPRLVLYGGEDYKTFLGCFNCNNFDAESVCNRYGEHGSRFAGRSIWNKLDAFGSRYSDQSPWNPYADQPPALFDRVGNFQGFFTANVYNPRRTRVPELIALSNQWLQVTDDPEVAAERYCARK
jgi:hypothetical protein